MENNNIIYANSISMVSGEMELRILFEVETPILTDDSITSVQKDVSGDVRINPRLAKQMMQMLNTHIDAYEKQFGEILTESGDANE
ncbi:MAG: DUF3467 domain-containing protein [Lachnospiraceae bacterium]|nr:DUF3467 domain-containing protein [Lachnospiraceae bacterium]